MAGTSTSQGIRLATEEGQGEEELAALITGLEEDATLEPVLEATGGLAIVEIPGEEPPAREAEEAAR